MDKQKILQALRAVRERLARGWVQRDFAVDEFGASVTSCDPRACCWCLSGAWIAACNAELGPKLSFGVADAWTESHVFLMAAIHEKALRPLDVISYNDATGRTKAEVLAVADRAIELCEAAA